MFMFIFKLFFKFNLVKRTWSGISQICNIQKSGYYYFYFNNVTFFAIIFWFSYIIDNIYLKWLSCQASKDSLVRTRKLTAKVQERTPGFFGLLQTTLALYRLMRMLHSDFIFHFFIKIFFFWEILITNREP